MRGGGKGRGGGGVKGGIGDGRSGGRRGRGESEEGEEVGGGTAVHVHEKHAPGVAIALEKQRRGEEYLAKWDGAMGFGALQAVDED